MQEKDDILAAFDIQDLLQQQEKTIESSVQETQIVSSSQENEDITVSSNYSILKKISGSGVFLVKYFMTSACIFGVLMLTVNYSAYWNIASSVIYAEDMEITKKSLIESVAAASVDKEEKNPTSQQNTFKQLSEGSTEKHEYTPDIHAISGLVKNIASENIDLGIDITPYENRIVIPTIGKNIPLIDIKQQKVNGIDELNDIFMDELENGVIRYPGSAKPGEEGNAFIFGHSSNFPWIKGEYNDVFALLDHVTYDDEVVIYYGHEKYTYKIRTKDVISPGDVSILKSRKNDNSKITLMTCWPIGTTLNRLVLTGDLISVE